MIQAEKIIGTGLIGGVYNIDIDSIDIDSIGIDSIDIDSVDLDSIDIIGSLIGAKAQVVSGVDILELILGLIAIAVIFVTFMEIVNILNPALSRAELAALAAEEAAAAAAKRDAFNRIAAKIKSQMLFNKKSRRPHITLFAFLPTDTSRYLNPAEEAILYASLVSFLETNTLSRIPLYRFEADGSIRYDVEGRPLAHAKIHLVTLMKNLGARPV